ncbi:MAG: LytTR family DNA-binding domain-containing protein [Dokdonella sp.]
MKTLVVDDEPLARERLISMLSEIGDIEVVGEAANGAQTLELCATLHPDLVLLDIRMPVMDGLEAAGHLDDFDPAPAVVFCTAFGDHALAAFEANAVDYLVKPIRIERLRTAIARAKRYTRAEIHEVDHVLTPTRRRSHLCARVRGNLQLVPVAAIRYLLAGDKYVSVRYDKGEVLIEDALKSLEDEFGERFVRIHRNCLVALEHLTGLTRTPDGRVLARVDGVPSELEVSRRNLPAVRLLVKSL